MEINNCMDYETEKTFRIYKCSTVKEFHNPVICSYCNSPDIEYFCYHYHCDVYACKKCAFKHGHFDTSKIDIEYKRIYSNNKIFWYCNRDGKNGIFGLDKGFWLNETIFISHTRICDGCKKIFPIYRLKSCVPELYIKMYFCYECNKIK
jgi:hypothetical protein